MEKDGKKMTEKEPSDIYKVEQIVNKRLQRYSRSKTKKEYRVKCKK